MRIEIKSHNVERFQAALDKRQELLHMRTHDMPRDYGEQLSEAHNNRGGGVGRCQSPE